MQFVTQAGHVGHAISQSCSAKPNRGTHLDLAGISARQFALSSIIPLHSAEGLSERKTNTQQPSKRAPRRSAGGPSVFEDCVGGIVASAEGEERNMYPYIRDLFTRVLGFPSDQVFTDVQVEEGGIPDIRVEAPIGVLDARGKDLKSRWLVGEAKARPGVFLDEETRSIVFAEKSKYIDLNTVWFLMVDPECFVLRAVTTRTAVYDPKLDVVLRWRGLTEETFRSKCIEIEAGHAGVNRRLQAFREDRNHPIAAIKLSLAHDSPESRRDLALARNEFYRAMRTSAHTIQAACRRALQEIVPKALQIRQLLLDFDAKYQIAEFALTPFKLTGRHEVSREEFQQRHRDIHAIAKTVKQNYVAAQLGYFTFPSFLERAKDDQEKACDLLAAETSSLLLARCMMLRFFEDHGYFGDKRYLCNGGIKAFQEMRGYYGTSYTKMLRETFGEGARIYPPVFSESELDWVLTMNSGPLSAAIERSLFYLSHFDFATIEQDVLSNIYGQFLDTAQRKTLGEHYTPPEVARYIVQQLGLKSGDKVIDPACGLGTFIIEAYKSLAGDAANLGAASFEDILKALSDVRGNDLNPFSATIAQIQLLWHLFSFRDEIKMRGFPETNITGGHNSLRHQALTGELFDANITEFSALDVAEYAAVVGNPPYVRPERQVERLREVDEQYFTAGGLSGKIDLYSYFIYKAMEGWCQPGTATAAPGKLGFVVPIAFCDNGDNKFLRSLFQIGGKWTIREIYDLELIGPLVFTADVVPILLIAERRPATANDKIRLRIADERCAKFVGIEEKHVEFALDKAPVTELSYADAFSMDGRILTKLSPERKRITDRLRGTTFNDIAQKFWIGRGAKQRIERWSIDLPEDRDGYRWEESDMIRSGAAFRNQKPAMVERGFDVYKGENMVACRLEGDPQQRSIDPLKMDDPSLWRFTDLLPETGYGFQQISPALTCAPVELRKTVLLNTVSLFVPEARLRDFPFDFLVQSRVFQYYFALTQREGILFRARCHVYPGTVRRLPWSEELAKHTKKLHGLRESFLVACEKLHQRSDVLREMLKSGPHSSFRDAILASRTKVEWSEELLQGKSVAVDDPILVEREDSFAVQFSDDLVQWVATADRSLAETLLEGLKLYGEAKIERSMVLSLSVPAPNELNAWKATVKKFDAQNYTHSIDGILDELDDIVAAAFGLSKADLAAIKLDFATDPMLRRVRPNLPFKERRRVGMRSGLTSDRYRKAYKTRN